jgi:putative endonuclease
VLAWVYMLRCADGLYYVGSHRGPDIEVRVWEHNNRLYPDAWTADRLPVELVWAEAFDRAEDAVRMERRLKGWSRAKKEAVIRGDWDALPSLARGRSRPPHPSTGSG